jgi:hypothetical protein
MCALYKAVNLVYAVVPFGAVFKNNDFAILLSYRYLQPLYAITTTLISNDFLTSRVRVGSNGCGSIFGKFLVRIYTDTLNILRFSWFSLVPLGKCRGHEVA